MDSRSKAWLSECSVVVVSWPAGLSSLAGTPLVAMSFVPACKAGVFEESSEHPCVGIAMVDCVSMIKSAIAVCAREELSVVCDLLLECQVMCGWVDRSDNSEE